MRDTSMMTALMNHFQQYSWCPNCGKEKAELSYNKLLAIKNVDEELQAPMNVSNEWGI